MGTDRVDKDKNTGSGEQTAPGPAISGSRPPNNDVDKDSRDRGARATRPTKFEREGRGS